MRFSLSWVMGPSRRWSRPRQRRPRRQFLYVDSAVIATEEVTEEAIASYVRGNSQDGDDSEPDEQDTCDVPSNLEVVDVIDVLRRSTSTQQDEDAMQAIWLC
uniref:Uncharacterized protein n=1 Tax=Ixodes ricinus TaxID=34613 RepID=A0A6B0UF64_IXORI